MHRVCLNFFEEPRPGVGNLRFQSHMRLFVPSVVAPFVGKQRSFLGIIFGITEVFGPDGSFAAPAGFRR